MEINSLWRSSIIIDIMCFFGILVLLNLGLGSTAFMLLDKAKNVHPRGYGTAKHAVIIGKFLRLICTIMVMVIHIFMHGQQILTI